MFTERISSLLPHGRSIVIRVAREELTGSTAINFFFYLRTLASAETTRIGQFVLLLGLRKFTSKHMMLCLLYNL